MIPSPRTVYNSAHLKLLADATLVMLEGVHVVPRVIEGERPASAHHVEYVNPGGMQVPVDHDEVNARNIAKAG
jgi:hypothetical protein